MKDLKKRIGMNPFKRDFIQFFASIYGPVGYINPFVFSFKSLFQQLCLSKIQFLGYGCYG